MRHFLTAAAMSVACMCAAAATPALNVTIEGVTGGRFPQDSVSCVADGHGKYSETGHDMSPGLHWSAGPAGTKSYAIVMTDPDVPTDVSGLNKDGVVVAANVPRKPIYHWVLVDVPADRTHLSPGDGKVFAEIFGVPRGNAKGEGLMFYAGGYGGPCPPWNDMRPHHYRIQVFALDVSSLGLTQPFDGKHAEAAMAGHTLAMGEASAAYATNAKLGTGY